MWQPSNLLRSAFSQNARPIKTTKVTTSLAKELSFTISPHAYRLGSPMAARFPHDGELFIKSAPSLSALASTRRRPSKLRGAPARCPRTKASAIARTTSHGNEAGTGITLLPACLLGLRWARRESRSRTKFYMQIRLRSLPRRFLGDNRLVHVIQNLHSVFTGHRG
jgi:hypothetical protein